MTVSAVVSGIVLALLLAMGGFVVWAIIHIGQLESKCESLGGIYSRGQCFEPSATIDMEGT